MTLDNFLEFFTAYLLPFMGLPLLGVVVGAWLTNSFFPFQLKRREWRWDKELWAKELFFETVSRINFIADHYMKSECEERFSMSGLGLREAEEEIMRLVKELHSVGYKLKLYLNRSDAKIFDEYLCSSQLEYDAAKDSWGMWEPDDEISPVLHSENTIAGQGKIAAKVLEKFKLSS
ncbi:hypothetical protein [Parathalassolituus penaei]|uniref:Uncharacterized protein n=1 Tax=Parathalassolituus penaei TaxID=2997323 RepID=A0A9X3EAN2_9GAMM|nr:hypothetical protein [Parathalassolituus penaei]MCY0964047.1 hypothetical protein [Parathalassolituus penaei]